MARHPGRTRVPVVFKVKGHSCNFIHPCSAVPAINNSLIHLQLKKFHTVMLGSFTCQPKPRVSGSFRSINVMSPASCETLDLPEDVRNVSISHTHQGFTPPNTSRKKYYYIPPNGMINTLLPKVYRHLTSVHLSVPLLYPII